MLAVRALAVTILWYQAAIGALALWMTSLPTSSTSDDSCSGLDTGSCLSDPGTWDLMTAAVLAVPAVATGALVSLATLLITLAARIRSALLAGTVAAFAGGAAALVVVLILLTAG
jgi:hypothetical protein